MRKEYEDYGYILDFLPEGHPDDSRPIYLKNPIIQLLGEGMYTLLEAVPMKDVTFEAQERLFIGKGERERLDYVKGRVDYERLSATAKAELPYLIEKLIETDPAIFVDFFNKARPLTTRFHQLELLPGIGKKLMKEVLGERRKGPFQSMDDISQRIRLIPAPKKMFTKRVLSELKYEDKYAIFVRRKPRE